MKRFGMAATLLMAGTLGAAGCSSDATSPTAVAAPRAPALSVTADDASAQHLVLFKGNGIPAGFAAQVQALGGTVLYTHAGVGMALVSGLSDAAAAQVGALSSVQQIDRDAAVSLDDPQQSVQADASDAINSQANPAAAARYPWQWNMRLIHADRAWAAGKLGSASVTVAIIDTGIDYDAPDLNGLVDLSRSASFVASDDRITSTYFPSRSPISDYNGHGTNVATQVSSKGVALAGVTSHTTLIGVKVLNAAGSGSFGSIVSGILWAADHGANVANMSLGGSFSKAANGRLVAYINRVFNYAKRQGMLIVVSAGNDAANLDQNGNTYADYCDAAHVVCVSSVGPATPTSSPDQPSYFTNFGRSSISVAAPGGNADAANGFALHAWPWGTDVASWVWSYCSKTVIARFTASGAPVLTACAAGNRISGFIGTSQASPHVSGLAALLVAEYGAGNPSQIKNRIEQSALDLGEPGTDPYYGKGRIDVASALGL